MADYLPEEIVEKILLRLPVKTLIKFTAVCKSWLSLIKTPTFVQSHLHTTIDSNNQNDSNLFLLSAFSCSREEAIFHDHLWLHWDSPEFGEYSKLPNPLTFFTPENKPYGLSVIGTCNGLLCLQSYYYHIREHRFPILIWNPSIRKIVKLPTPPALQTPTEDWIYNVYSSAKGSWRRLSASVAPVDLQAEGWEKPTYINGCWHMSRKCKHGGDSFIAYFNLATEVFGEIMIPEALRKERCSISRYEDFLALIKHSNYHHRNLINGSFDKWVMKQYGVAESWTYLFNIIPVVEGIIHGFKRCGEVVLLEIKDHGQSKMISFNPKTNQVRDFGSEDYVYVFMDSFVESLVLLDHAKAISTE